MIVSCLRCCSARQRGRASAPSAGKVELLWSRFSHIANDISSSRFTRRYASVVSQVLRNCAREFLYTNVATDFPQRMSRCEVPHFAIQFLIREILLSSRLHVSFEKNYVPRAWKCRKINFIWKKYKTAALKKKFCFRIWLLISYKLIIVSCFCMRF